MLKRVALVTSRDYASLPDDDRPLLAELGRLGIAALPRVWDDPEVPWAQFDALVLRSTWDYHRRIAEFRIWVEARGEDGSVVWNPPELLAWNTHKFYLREVERKGLSIVPTRFLSAGAAEDLGAVLRSEGWTKAVVKPAVSATAHRTRVSDAGSLAEGQAELTDILADGDALVQEYLPEIESDGELSLVYIDGAFSHAVRKVPAPGDFRVQEEFGGRAEPIASVDPAVRREADRCVAAVEYPWLYARVDGVVSDGRFRLMELEMVEPSLYLSASPDAARRLALAIVRLVDPERSPIAETATAFEG